MSSEGPAPHAKERYVRRTGWTWTVVLGPALALCVGAKIAAEQLNRGFAAVPGYCSLRENAPTAANGAILVVGIVLLAWLAAGALTQLVLLRRDTGASRGAKALAATSVLAGYSWLAYLAWEWTDRHMDGGIRLLLEGVFIDLGAALFIGLSTGFVALGLWYSGSSLSFTRPISGAGHMARLAWAQAGLLVVTCLWLDADVLLMNYCP